MKTKNKIIATILAFMMVILPFSVSAEGFEFALSPKAEKFTTNSVSLSWEEIAWAEGYVVLYDTVSVASSQEENAFYSNETDDLIFENNTTITGLEPGITYYFAVTALDFEGNETPASPELAVSTIEADVELNAAEEEALAPTEIKSISSNQIEVKFNVDLDGGEKAVREFSILDENENEIFIDFVEMTSKDTLVLNLVSELENGLNYSVVIIALQDKDGNNIEAGVDGIISLEASFEPSENLEEVMEEASNEAEETKLETTKEVLATEEVEEEVKEEKVEKAVEEVAEEAKELPETWAKENIIIFLSIIITMFVTLRKKAY